jgi:PKD repeat protein
MQKIIFLSTVLFVTILISCQKQPTASFNVGNSNIKVGTVVAFTNTSQDADSYVWNFGDGTQSTDENPSHTYNAEGNFTITLQALSKNGKKKNSATNSIVVAAATPAIIATDFTYSPSTIYVGEAVTFTAQTSSSTVSWNFGDGTNSSLKNPTHSYDNTGFYDVVLTAGGTTKTKNIFVTNAASGMAGNYNVEDLCSGSTSNYTDLVTISSSENKRISVAKFANYSGGNVYFIVNGNSITLPSQDVLCGIPAATRNFSGTGYIINANSFSINFTETTNGTSITCTETYTK